MSAFSQTLCGQAWVDSTAPRSYWVPSAQISDTLCSCPRGHLFVNTASGGPRCDPCPAGRYEAANVVKTTTCKACSAGKYSTSSSGTRQISIDICNNTCAPGTFSPPGASADGCATTCPAGFSKDPLGTAACIFAPADRSALQTALLGCIGACAGALDGDGDYTMCSSGKNGGWDSGTGADCHSTSTYGAIDTWDVSRVTVMRRLFRFASAFNVSISSWNVASVTNMDEMFRDASAFNQDLSSWDVTSVTSMGSMFYDASAFNQDISSWKLTSVTSMSHMFYDASAFSQTLCGQAWVDKRELRSAWVVSAKISDTPCSCSSGHYLDNINVSIQGGPACRGCPAGQYQDTNSVTAGTCKACPAGTFSPPVASAACASACPASFSKDLLGSAAACIFAPEDRSVLQTALFECVGACNDLRGLGDETYCDYNDDGPWKSGTGADCCDAASTHGAIDTWEVSRVTTMRYRECTSLL